MDRLGWIKLIIWVSFCLLVIVFAIVYVVQGVIAAESSADVRILVSAVINSAL